MFSKQAKQTSPDGGATRLDALPPPAEGARKAPKAASIISGDLVIEGSVAGEGELHVDGAVRGDIRVAKLTVGETGHVEGAIFTESADVRGRIIGSLTAKQVRLYGTAYVDGDVTHEQLSIELGAFFQGRSLKFQHPSAPIAAPAEPETQTKAKATTD